MFLFAAARLFFYSSSFSTCCPVACPAAFSGSLNGTALTSLEHTPQEAGHFLRMKALFLLHSSLSAHDGHDGSWSVQTILHSSHEAGQARNIQSGLVSHSPFFFHCAHSAAACVSVHTEEDDSWQTSHALGHFIMNLELLRHSPSAAHAVHAECASLHF